MFLLLSRQPFRKGKDTMNKVKITSPQYKKLSLISALALGMLLPCVHASQSTKEKAEEMKDTAEQKLETNKDRAQVKIDEAKVKVDEAKEEAGTLKEKAAEKTKEMTEKAKELYESGKEKAATTYGNVKEAVKEKVGNAEAKESDRKDQ